jgi:hypothetical protein
MRSTKGKRMLTSATKSEGRSALPTPRVGGRYLAEPSLRFCGGASHINPQIGVVTYGPRSLDLPRHPSTIRCGLVGSGVSLADAEEWLRSCAQGVEGEGENLAFPGCTANAGYFADVRTGDDWKETISQAELAEVRRQRGPRARFEAGLALISDKLRILSTRDQPPDYVVLALPQEILELCSVADYRSGGGRIHRDLRRAVKAAAMRYHLPTELLRAQTIRGGRNVDHKSRCAWNFYNGLYFKAGGLPWGPSGLTPGSCYLGIGFYRPLGSNSTVRASIALAFNEHADGLVLRGQPFPWDDDKDGASPHLTRERARDLIGTILQRYRDEMKQTPRRLIIHKTSAFWPDERAGFEEGLVGVSRCDFVAMAPTDEIRFLRAGQYPTLRGTWLRLGDVDLLYTTGYLPSLAAYPHGHVPSPLKVFDHGRNDTPVDEVMRELLVLTKMNWNSTAFAGLLPITLRFARRVGDILREVPADQEPLPQYKYYT